jgi:hypothetical protein
MFPNLLPEKSGQFWALVAFIQSTSHKKTEKLRKAIKSAVNMLYS